MKPVFIGLKGSLNVAGKQVALPAITPANQAASYTFSTASTATIGDAVVTKRVGSGQGGDSQNWADPGYDNAAMEMIFNGTNQAIAYSPTNALQVAPLPFSFQIDFNTSKIVGSQYVMNMGQGNSVGWPCLQAAIFNNNLYVSIGTRNDGTGITSWDISKVQTNMWYRLGIMLYRVGTVNYLRVYFNGEVKVQVVLGTSATNASGEGGIPRRIETSGPAGVAFGADNANTRNFNFQGRMRNVFMENTLFWPI